MAGGYSYNGWPASDSASAIGVNQNWQPLSGIKFPGGIKGGDVEVVFTYLVVELNKIEACVNGWNWGWSYRANVNNPSELSCHASATAIDYNAPNHPNGTSTGPNGGGGWSSSEYSRVTTVLGFLEGVVRWLTGNDPMHFEIHGSTADAKRVADKIRALGADDMTPDECRQVVREELTKFFTKDLVTIDGDEMSNPPTNKMTRDNRDERTNRLTSIAAAHVTGRDGKYTTTDGH